MREIYFRDESDPNYIPDILEVSNEIEALIYQLRMILGTSNGEVLGQVGFGANMEDMLFAYDFNPELFNAGLIEQTNLYSELARSYNLQFSVKKIQQDRHRDLGLVDIAINGKSIFGFIY